MKMAPKAIWRKCECRETIHRCKSVSVLCDDGREYLKRQYVCINCNRRLNTKHADNSTTAEHTFTKEMRERDAEWKSQNKA